MKSYNFTSEEKKRFADQITADSKSGFAKIVHEYYDKTIPIIFDNLDGAKKYIGSNPNNDVLGRTGLGALDEGYNGIISSISLHQFSKEGYSLETEKEARWATLHFSRKCELRQKDPPPHRLFCKYLGLKPGSFVKRFSLVFWEKIPGVNCSIFIDPDNSKEYTFCSEGSHKAVFITKNNSLLEEKILSNVISKDNKIIPSSFPNLNLVREHIFEFPSLYRDIQQINEEIGQTPLGKKNFGMMEAQMGLNQKIYFLQWTKGIPFNNKKNEFKLSLLSENEFAQNRICKSELVRGSTYPISDNDWKSFCIELVCPNDVKARINRFGLYDKEDGAVYFSTADRIYNEAAYPRRKIQILNTEGKRDAGTIFAEIAGDHHIKSAFTKVGLFFAGNLSNLFSKEELDFAYSVAMIKNHSVFVNLDCISDGDTGYLRRGKYFGDVPFFIPSYDIPEDENYYEHKNLAYSLSKDPDIKIMCDIQINYP